MKNLKQFCEGNIGRKLTTHASPDDNMWLVGYNEPANRLIVETFEGGWTNLSKDDTILEDMLYGKYRYVSMRSVNWVE